MTEQISKKTPSRQLLNYYKKTYKYLDSEQLETILTLRAEVRKLKKMDKKELTAISLFIKQLIENEE